MAHISLFRSQRVSKKLTSTLALQGVRCAQETMSWMCWKLLVQQWKETSSPVTARPLSISSTFSSTFVIYVVISIVIFLSPPPLPYQSSCIFLCHLCCIFFALLLLLEPICALHSFGIFIGSILCFCIITCNKIVLLFCISFFLQNLQDKSHLQVETNLREGSLAVPTFLFTIGQNKICFRIFGSPQ